MNSDIVSILYRIKSNISLAERGETNAGHLQEIHDDFLNLAELIKLFLISERDTYYGYFLMNLRFDVDFTTDTIAGIRLDSFPPVFFTNPLLLCKYSLKEILYIFCHEIDHILLNHPAEMLKVNPFSDPEAAKKFNLAADASVNDRINYEIKQQKRLFLERPKGAITSGVLQNMFQLRHVRPLENYAYYYNLIRDLDSSSAEEQSSRMLSHLQGQTDSGSQSVPSQDKSSPDTSEPTSIVTAANCGELSDHQWSNDPMEPDEASSVIKEFINASVSMMDSEKRSRMPAHFESAIAEINKPPVLSWQAILKKYVGTIASSKTKTRARLNRRQPHRFDLSGEKPDTILKIVVAIDTSGSVEDEQVEQFFIEILGILAKRRHEITVIECDDDIQKVYKIRTASDIPKTVSGRGGTSFTPVINYINKDPYFRDALLIYFTDGFGEYKIPRPKTYRNLWIVLDDTDNLSLEEPYGMKVKL
ncbi:MAG: hypothetical protein E7223_00445 [Clostridiales bacterium]|nr:hypothetical protein [Clostridiales bacterium]